MNTENIKPSEALYTFVAWLASSEKELIIGSNHECGILAELVNDFCKENNLEEPSGEWHKNLKYPASFPTN